MEDWSTTPGVGESIWGCTLVVLIFAVNVSVLVVVGKSRGLWKPRHLWMASLCVTDLFVCAHKGLELSLLVLPQPQQQLCVVQKTTLGIPYVVNMLLLTLLSLDRFVAVRHPFFYSASVNNKHVLVGFCLVLLAGGSLAAASVTLGLRDPICQPQIVQLVCLAVVLAICSILTLFFNSAVLRIAKRQLNAIYAQEPPRRVSVVCANCGHKNETFYEQKEELHIVVLPPEEGRQMERPSLTSGDEILAPLVRTISLPTITDPKAPLVHFDPLPEEGRGSCTRIPMELPLPRSRSLVTCRAHKLFPPNTSRLHLFKNLHFSRNNVFHVGRLFPSIRFARTVLLIMIPMWIFLLPIVIIIPLYRECRAGNESMDCNIVHTLWKYLQVHMRSVLPIQAILDTLIYACGSKEFRQAVGKLIRSSKK